MLNVIDKARRVDSLSTGGSVGNWMTTVHYQCNFYIAVGWISPTINYTISLLHTLKMLQISDLKKSKCRPTAFSQRHLFH